MPKNVECQYYFIHTITSLIGFGMVIAVVYWIVHYKGGLGIDSETLFNYHPFLMTLATIFIFSQGILIFRTTRHCPREVSKCIHVIFLLTTVLLSVIGFVCVVKSRDSHMHTLHSWIGLTTLILLFGNFIFAFGCFVYPGVSQNLRDILCPVHFKIGAGIFMGAVITGVSGITQKAVVTKLKFSKDGSDPPDSQCMNMIGFFMCLYGILITYLVKEPAYKNPKKKNRAPIEEQPSEVVHYCNRYSWTPRMENCPFY